MKLLLFGVLAVLLDMGFSKRLNDDYTNVVVVLKNGCDCKFHLTVAGKPTGEVVRWVRNVPSDTIMLRLPKGHDCFLLRCKNGHGDVHVNYTPNKIIYLTLDLSKPQLRVL